MKNSDKLLQSEMRSPAAAAVRCTNAASPASYAAALGHTCATNAHHITTRQTAHRTHSMSALSCSCTYRRMRAAMTHPTHIPAKEVIKEYLKTKLTTETFFFQRWWSGVRVVGLWRLILWLRELLRLSLFLCPSPPPPLPPPPLPPPPPPAAAAAAISSSPPQLTRAAALCEDGSSCCGPVHSKPNITPRCISNRRLEAERLHSFLAKNHRNSHRQ